MKCTAITGTRSVLLIQLPIYHKSNENQVIVTNSTCFLFCQILTITLHSHKRDSQLCRTSSSHCHQNSVIRYGKSPCNKTPRNEKILSVRSAFGFSNWCKVYSRCKNILCHIGFLQHIISNEIQQCKDWGCHDLQIWHTIWIIYITKKI